MSGSGQIEIEDVAYSTPASGPLLARLYRPKGKGPCPAVVSVHGGRWVSQTRLTNEVLDRALAEAGIVVMAIDFRMPPAVRYPEPVADINLAIRWLKHHAARFGSDACLVGAMGTSSGGHQVMLNALRPRDPRYAALPLSGCEETAELAFAVACWPVLDPLARYRMALAKNMEEHIKSHDLYWPDEASMGEGNPQLILERGERVPLPPLLLIQGTGDRIVPAEMTQRFEATYRERGGDVSLELFADRPHTFITNEPELAQSKDATTKIARFILGQGEAAARRGGLQRHA